jgi:hypothetical protein
MEANRIYFKDNPYPGGHRINKFVWSGRLDEAERLWFDFHLQTDDYYAEDDTEENDEEEESDWKAKTVWGNYHNCILSSTQWGKGGVLLPEGNEGFDLPGLQQLELTADLLPLDPDLDDEDLAFHIYLLGHDSCADHRIRLSRNADATFRIEWTGRIALTYAGEEEFDHSFSALIENAVFDGFYLPQQMEVERAMEAFGRRVKNREAYQLTDLNPKSNRREYKLQLMSVS